MRIFNCLKLSVKMAIGFAVPLMVIIGSSTAVFIVSRMVEADSNKVVSEYTDGLAVTAAKMQYDAGLIQQWLTDISATRGLNGMDDGFTEAAAAKDSFEEGIEKLHAAYIAEDNSVGLDKVSDLEETFDDYYSSGTKMAQGYIDGGPELGNTMMSDFDRANTDLQRILDGIIVDEKGKLLDAIGSISGLASLQRNAVLYGGVFAIFLTIGLTVTVIRAITIPLNKLADELNSGSTQVAAASSQISESSTLWPMTRTARPKASTRWSLRSGRYLHR